MHKTEVNYGIIWIVQVEGVEQIAVQELYLLLTRISGLAKPINSECAGNIPEIVATGRSQNNHFCTFSRRYPIVLNVRA